MGDTPNSGETGDPKAPENGTQQPAPAQGNAGPSADLSEVEKLRKERDQAQMRANQLEREKQQREADEAKRNAKELEEQNEYKTLWEQANAKIQSIETEREAEERKKAIEAARAEVLGGYPEEVKATAAELGIDLSSADDEARTTFKEKLDKIQEKVSADAKVTPNNPGAPSRQPVPSQDELRVKLKSPEGFADEIAKRPGLAQMTNQTR